MKLIDRYLQEIKKHLPRKKREDILAELRSSLVDALEDQAGPDPSEEEIAAFLQEFGSPREVSASYHPQGQYLIGPALYPLFRLVAWITLGAVTGAQVLAWTVALLIGEEPFAPLQALGGLISSIPGALGWVVVVFLILQWYDVQPELETEDWDPADLPPLRSVEQEVKRGEVIVGLVFSILILVLVSFFPEKIGFVATPGWTFYSNPVIIRYLGWIVASLLAGILLDIYLLWQGHWQTATRVLKIGINLFSIAVLALLFQGHNAWLVERGAAGFLSTLERFEALGPETWQLVGMHAFRLAFGVALVVTVIETLVLVYNLVKPHLQGDVAPGALPQQTE